MVDIKLETSASVKLLLLKLKFLYHNLLRRGTSNFLDKSILIVFIKFSVATFKALPPTGVDLEPPVPEPFSISLLLP